MQKIWRRLADWTVTGAMVLSLFPLPVYAQTDTPNDTDSGSDQTADTDDTLYQIELDYEDPQVLKERKESSDSDSEEEEPMPFSFSQSDRIEFDESTPEDQRYDIQLPKLDGIRAWKTARSPYSLSDEEAKQLADPDADHDRLEWVYIAPEAKIRIETFEFEVGDPEPQDDTDADEQTASENEQQNTDQALPLDMQTLINEFEDAKKTEDGKTVSKIVFEPIYEDEALNQMLNESEDSQKQPEKTPAQPGSPQEDTTDSEKTEVKTENKSAEVKDESKDAEAKPQEESESEPAANTETADDTDSNDSAADEMDWLSETQEKMPKLEQQEFVTMAKVPSDAAKSSYPSEGDGQKIENITFRWLNTDDAEYLQAPQTNDPITYAARLQFSLSGTKTWDTGSVSITVPKVLFKNRSGQMAGDLSMGIPAAPDNRAAWVYTEDEDNIIITNNRPMPAATAAYIDFYWENITPSQVEDTVSTDNASADIDAVIHAVTPNDTILQATSNTLTAGLDTYAKLTNITQVNYDVQTSWDPSWPAAMKPDNADEYVYVHWYGYVYADGNQPYTLSVKDLPALTNGRGGEFTEVKLLGMTSGNQSVVGSDPLVLRESTQDFAGKWLGYTHVYTAYPLDDFKEAGTYTITNNMEYTLTPADDKDASVLTSKSVAYFYNQLFDGAAGHFDQYKSGALGDEIVWFESGLYRMGMNSLMNGKDAVIRYSNQLSGFGYPWTVNPDWQKEGLTQEDPDNPGQIIPSYEAYGYQPWGMEQTDGTLYFNEEQNGDGSSAAKLVPGEDYEFKSLDVGTPRLFEYVKFTKKQPGYYEDKGLGNGGVISYGMVQQGQWGYQQNDSLEKPVVEVYGQTAVDGEWIHYADISDDPQFYNGATASDNPYEVVFPEGVLNYKVKFSTKLAAALYTMTPTIAIHSSDKLKEQIQNLWNQGTYAVNIRNIISGRVLNNTDDTLFSLPDRYGRDKLTGTYVAAWLDKAAETEPDAANQLLNMTYTLTAHEQTNITSLSQYEQALSNGQIEADTSGVFYDLLPQGVIPDLNSIQIRTGDTLESVERLYNYKDTGRTLLIFHLNLTSQPVYQNQNQSGMDQGYAQLPYVKFNAVYPYSSVKDYGTKIQNVAAYASETASLGTLKGYIGEPNDPAAGNNYSSQDVKDYWNVLKDLPIDAQSGVTNNFIYDQLNQDLNFPTAGTFGLSKLASVNQSGIYKNGQDIKNADGTWDESDVLNAYAGGLYEYRIAYNSADNSLQDLVFYDSIENFIPGKTLSDGSGDQDEDDTQWHGTLLSIDLDALKAKGIAPVVYGSPLDLTCYSTDSEQLNTADAISKITATDFSDPANQWKVIDLSKANDASVFEGIKTIAIDCSKKADGSDYVMPANDQVSFTLRMRAPSDLPETAYDTPRGDTEAGDAGGWHAYNNTSVKATQNTYAGNVPMLVRQGYTKVGVIPYSLDVVKAWDDNDDQDGIRPDSVNVQLLANNEPVSGKTAELNESNNWSATFDQISLVDDQGNPYYFSIKEDTIAGYKATLKIEDSENGQTATLTNRHTPDTISVAGEKIWTDDNSNAQNTRPESILVKLYADGKLYSTQRVLASQNWQYSFTGLPKNKDKGTAIVYTVEEPDYIEGYSTSMPEPSTDDAGNITQNIENVYYPYGDLKVSKQIANTETVNPDQEFSFELQIMQGDQMDGNSYTLEIYNASNDELVSTDSIQTGQSISIKADQYAIVKDIPSGSTYQLEEAKNAGWSLTQTSGSTGMIKSKQEANAVFTNKYQATGMAYLTAEKTLTGRELEAYQFRFQVTDQDGNVIRTASNTADGKVNFGAIRYQLSDVGKTYTYTISEMKQDMAGYTPDTKTVQASVTISDNGDGTLKADVTYTEDGKTVDTPSFANTYQASGTLNLQAFKQMTGTDLKDKQFTFELEKQNPENEDEWTSVATGYNAENGDVKFPLEFTQDDAGKTYRYRMTEQESSLLEDGTYGKDPNIVYSDATYEYIVEVIDNGNGTLGFNLSYPDGQDKPVFENSLQDGTLAITKGVDNDEGTYDPAKEFEFKITLQNPDGTPYTGKLDSVPEAITPAVLNVKAQMSADYDSQPLSGMSYNLYYTPADGTKELLNDTPLVTDDNGIISYRDFAKREEGGSYTAELVAYNGEDITSPTSVALNTTEVNNISYPMEIYAYLDPTDTTNLVFDKTIRPMAQQWFGKTTWSGSPSVEKDGTTYWWPDLTIPETWGRPWNNSTITKATINSEIRPIQTSTWFAEMPNLTAIENIKNLNTSLDTSMWGMFNNASGLTSIDLSGFDTSKVKSLAATFRGCGSLTSIDLSSFDTSNVTTMSMAFANCKNLTSIDLSSFNTENVESMNQMFSNDSGLESVNISSFDTSSVKDFSSMFQNCTSLKTLDVSNFDTSNGQIFSQMFMRCVALQSLDVSKFNTANATNMNSMFNSLNQITTLDVSNFNTSNVTNMANMFWSCGKLSNLDISNFDTSKVTAMNGMFGYCGALEALDISNFDTSHITSMDSMFIGDISLKTLNVSGLNTAQVTSLANTFNNCNQLTDLDLSSFDTSKVTSFENTFKTCSSLENLTLSDKWDVSSAVSMSATFYNCKNLLELDTSTWHAPNCKGIGGAFNLSGIKKLDLSNFGANSVTDAINSLRGMSNVTSIDLSNWQLPDKVDLSYMLCENPKLQEVNVSGMNIGSSANTTCFFNGSNAINKLVIGPDFKFNTNMNLRNASWIKEGTTSPVYTTSELITAYNADPSGLAGTWEVQSTANAVAAESNEIETESLDAEPALLANDEKIDMSLVYGVLDENGQLTFDKATAEQMNTWFASATNLRAEIDGKIYYQCTGFIPLSEYRPWRPDRANIKSVVFNTPVKFGSYANFLSGATNLASITGIENVSTTGARDLHSMFSDCNSLTSLDVSGFDTSSATDMSYMFKGCGLKTLDLNSWDVSKVGNMSTMFQGCGALTEIDFDKWNTPSLKNIHYMFGGDGALKTADMSGWDMSKVTYGTFAFWGCSNLDVTFANNWKIQSLIDGSNMFGGCSTSMDTLDLTGWNTSNLTKASGMFQNMTSTKHINISNWGTSKLTDMSSMFSGCKALEELDVSKWDTSNVTNMDSTFRDLSKVNALKLNDWNTGKVTNMANMFFDSTISDLEISDWDVSKVTNMKSMFERLKGKPDLDLSKWQTDSLQAMTYIFSAAQISNLNLAGWNTSKVSNLSAIFYRANIGSLDVSGWDTTNVTSVNGAFNQCGIDTLDLSSWYTPKLQDMKMMLFNCFVKDLNVQNFDLSNVTNTLSALSTYNLQKVVLGPNWRFLNDMLLQQPSTSQSTGKWIREDRTYGPYTPAELATAYNADPSALAGTWIWQPLPTDYSLNFDANGGVGSMASQQLKAADAQTIPASTFWKIGYTQTGWNTAADGSGTQYALGATIPANTYKPDQAVTLYATYEKADTDINFENGEATIILHPNETINIPKLPGGMKYTIYENTPAGWQLVSSDNTSGTIQPNETTTSTFVNHYDPTKTSLTFVATKLLDGQPTDQTFHFTRWSQWGTVIDTATNDSTGQIHFGPAQYTSPGTYTYYLTEDAGTDTDNIKYDTNKITVTVVVEDINGVLTATPTYHSDPVFNNTTIPHYGSLSISKTVTGTTDTDTEFSFQITLSSDKTFEGTIGSEAVSVTNGSVIKLKAGQTLTIPQIDEGVTYSIDEIDVPAGYTSSTGTQSGTITRNENSTAEFENTYSATGQTFIQLNKTLAGKVPETGLFEFVLSPQDHLDDTTYMAQFGDTKQLVSYNDENGEIQFGPISYTEAGTYVYEATETDNPDYQCDTTKMTITVNVTDDGNGNLTADVVYPEKTTFENQYQTGTLTLKKQLEDESLWPDTEFSFTLSLLQADQTPDTGTYSATITEGDTVTDLTVKNGSVIQLKASQTLNIQGLPAGTNYSFTEADTPGWTQIETGSSLSGTITANADAEAIAINSYSASGMWTPTATKTLKNGVLAQGQFTFILQNASGQTIDQTQNMADGTVEFNGIALTTADIGKSQTYTIQEIAGESTDIRYDESVYQITITPEDDGKGNILPNAVITKDGQPADSVSFENESLIAMPLTGQPTFVIALASAFGLLLAAGYLYSRKRRQN